MRGMNEPPPLKTLDDGVLFSLSYRLIFRESGKKVTARDGHNHCYGSELKGLGGQIEDGAKETVGILRA